MAGCASNVGARRAAAAACTWLAVGLALAACSPAQAPAARRVGKVLAVGGATGLIAGSLLSNEPVVIGFSIVSGVGIGLYAAGELGQPGPRGETLPERHRRWAAILTERAAGAARDGRCARVRRLEPRVRRYNAEIHDFVFMRDPEILRCLSAPAPAPAAPAPGKPDQPAAPAEPDGSPPEPSAPAAPSAPAPPSSRG